MWFKFQCNIQCSVLRSARLFYLRRNFWGARSITIVILTINNIDEFWWSFILGPVTRFVCLKIPEVGVEMFALPMDTNVSTSFCVTNHSLLHSNWSPQIISNIMARFKISTIKIHGTYYATNNREIYDPRTRLKLSFSACWKFGQLWHCTKQSVSVQNDKRIFSSLSCSL